MSEQTMLLGLAGHWFDDKSRQMIAHLDLRSRLANGIRFL